MNRATIISDTSKFYVLAKHSILCIYHFFVLKELKQRIYPKINVGYELRK